MRHAATQAQWRLNPRVSGLGRNLCSAVLVAALPDTGGREPERPRAKLGLRTGMACDCKATWTLAPAVLQPVPCP